MELEKTREERDAAFNRTIEELKFSSNSSFIIFSLTFNRTIEELKLIICIKVKNLCYSFNRTIEELKSVN